MSVLREYLHDVVSVIYLFLSEFWIPLKYVVEKATRRTVKKNVMKLRVYNPVDKLHYKSAWNSVFL
jgi:hypothetical protein